MTDSQLKLIIEIISAILILTQALGIFIVQSILKNKIEFEFRKREQAAMVASLFAEWIDRPDNTKELNRLTWEANLWLPDELAKEINMRLANSNDAKDIRMLLIDIKKLIHGRRSSLNPAEIVYFPKKDI
ncbi:MAG: hypothetical protein ACOYYU_17940 [Chloroflexota bacterium]